MKSKVTLVVRILLGLLFFVSSAVRCLSHRSLLLDARDTSGPRTQAPA